MGIGCALVGEKAEMVAVEVEKLGSIDNSYPGIFLEIIHQKPYIIHKHGLGRNVRRIGVEKDDRISVRR